MLKNYFKSAVRNMKRQKIFSLINILGLAIGMTMAILILLWVQDENNYDRFHLNSTRIYRISQVFCNEGNITKVANTPAILAETLMLECPEVELATSIRGDRSSVLVTHGDNKFQETGIAITDHLFFQVFSFPFIEGDPETALSSPGTAVISQKAAKKYFKDTDPIGQTLNFYDEDFIITGIFQDMPQNSHFHFDVLCSKASFETYTAPRWEWSPFKTYVMLYENGSVESLQGKLNKIASTRMFGDGYAAWSAKGNYKVLPLQKLTDIHLHSNLLYEFEANGNSLYVRFFMIIAVFILLIAVINYMNLSTAHSAGRAQEVGIRKTVGSTRVSLIQQFLFESVLTSLVALAFTLIFTQLMLPSFRLLVGKSWLVMPYQEYPLFIPGLMIVAVVIGILSGFYPSFFLSAFKPIAALSGSPSKGMKSSRFRNGLVVLQFTLSVFLLVGTLVVQKQMDYVRKKDLGFNKEQVIVLQTLNQVDTKLSTLREALLQNTAIQAVSASSTIPGKEFDYIGFHVMGLTDSWPGANCIAADLNFLDVMKVEMKSGRYFSKDIKTDGQALILNESKARELGLDNVFEKRIMIGGMGDEPFHVIGIMKDFHYESLHEPVKSLGLVLLGGTCPWSASFVSIRIRSKNIQKILVDIRRIWEEVIPGAPFAFSFLDSIYNDQYHNEVRTGRIFTIFTLFAIFVACIGLLGLASFAAQQRTKEFGIRKVLGASVQRLILMLSGEFARWVMLANVFAWPLAYYIMSKWLNNFAYRTRIGVLPFLLSALIMFGITGLTLSYHLIRTAKTNPIDSLKYE
ncbi:ABC transporter permease [Acidobacteriota bacterium]